jgi:ribosomal protein L22
MSAEEETGPKEDVKDEAPAKPAAEKKPAAKAAAEKTAAKQPTAEKETGEAKSAAKGAAAKEPAAKDAAAKDAAAKGPVAKEAPAKGPAAKEPAEKKTSAAKKASSAKEPVATKESAKSEKKPARRAGKGATPAPRRQVVRAHARYVRTSARKARMVCGHLRGKSIEEARAILAFTPREVARDWSKLLESAVANAESNHELLEDDLIVREAYADEGPTIKRFRPRAMGRATPIRKRTSHLTITLTPDA